MVKAIVQPSALIMAIGPWVLLVMRFGFDICHKKCSAQVDGMILILFWAARLCRRG